MTVLFLSIEFNYCCGISRSIFSLSDELKLRGHRVILGAPYGTMVEDYISSGFEYVDIPIFPKAKKSFDFLICLIKIRKIVKDNNVKIIHSHHRLAELLALPIVWLLKIPTVSTAHAFIEGKKSLSFRSNKIIAVSEAIKKMLINDFQIDESRVQVIYNIPRRLKMPSDTKITDFKKSLNITANDFVVAGIGRLHKEKGFDILLQTFHQIQNNRIRLLIVGNGVEMNVLKDYAREHKLNVAFIDELKEVELIYSIAHVIVVPSRSESIGLVPIEAAFFKKPVIAANVGGLVETIMDGVTGILVPAVQPEKLNEAIMRLFANEELSKLLGLNLHSFVKEKYNGLTTVKKVERLYLELTNR